MAEATDSNDEAVASTPFLETLQVPIEGDAPAGDDVLYGDEFQRLKIEVDAIGSASGEADYEQIVELARTVLTEQSKDLRAAGYLVLGEARVNGAEGVAEAMRGIWLMIDEYWEELYPDGMRGRGGALQFIGDRLPDWLEAASFEKEDRPALVTTLEVLEKIQTFSLEEMGEHAPSLSGLVGDLEDEIDDLPEPDPDPEPETKSESAAEPEAESDGSTEASTDEEPSPEETEKESETEEAASAEPLSPFLEELCDPIDEEAPAGEDVLYGDEFQRLKIEVDAIGSASGEADYEQIIELARTVLTEQSKDLRAAGYLVLGEARVNGAEGVAEAMRGIRIMIDQYWEKLYPERMRSRGGALQFIGDRLPDWLASVSFEQEDRTALVTTLEILEEIQTFSLEEMGEHAPSLSGLVGDLEDEIDDLPEPEPEPEPDPEPESDSDASTDASTSEETTSDKNSSTPSSSGTASAAPTEVGSGDDAEQVVRTAAGYYREEDLTNPMSYRLIRSMRWSPLQSEPPNEGGTTRFEAPREQRREYLEGLLEEEEYETLVEEAESAFQGGDVHVWFDLQRLVAAALDALGKPYEEARQAVMVELAVLVDRVPRLLSLSFQNDVPFATPLTVDWIENEVQPLLGDGEEAEGAAADEVATVTEDHEEARKELSSGSLEEALACMEEGADEDTSEKERFYRQLYTANLCVKGDQPQIARPLLDELAQVIDEYTLDEWNPSLAIEVWSSRCQCYDLLAESASEEQAAGLRAEADASFEKVCQTDPVQAVSMRNRRS